MKLPVAMHIRLDPFLSMRRVCTDAAPSFIWGGMLVSQQERGA